MKKKKLFTQVPHYPSNASYYVKLDIEREGGICGFMLCGNTGRRAAGGRRTMNQDDPLQSPHTGANATLPPLHMWQRRKLASVSNANNATRDLAALTDKYGTRTVIAGATVLSQVDYRPHTTGKLFHVQ